MAKFQRSIIINCNYSFVSRIVLFDCRNTLGDFTFEKYKAKNLFRFKKGTFDLKLSVEEKDSNSCIFSVDAEGLINKKSWDNYLDRFTDERAAWFINAVYIEPTFFLEDRDYSLLEFSEILNKIVNDKCNQLVNSKNYDYTEFNYKEFISKELDNIPSEEHIYSKWQIISISTEIISNICKNCLYQLFGDNKKLFNFLLKHVFTDKTYRKYATNKDYLYLILFCKWDLFSFIRDSFRIDTVSSIPIGLRGMLYQGIKSSIKNAKEKRMDFELIFNFLKYSGIITDPYLIYEFK